jgi:phage terminase large subunit-like protein
LTHNIGNLTLLTQALNGGVSRGPFRDKRSAIAKQSRLFPGTKFDDQVDSTTQALDHMRMDDIVTTYVKAFCP